MTQDLTPIRARLERADLHFKALYALVGDIINDKAYGTRRELEVGGAHHVYYAVVTDDLQRQDIDKHRFVLTAVVNSEMLGYRFPPGIAASFVPGLGSNDPEGLKDGVELGRFIFDEPAPDVEVEFGPLLNVVFNKTGPGQGRPITQLGIWLAKVTTIVAAAENLP